MILKVGPLRYKSAADKKSIINYYCVNSIDYTLTNTSGISC